MSSNEEKIAAWPDSYADGEDTMWNVNGKAWVNPGSWQEGLPVSVSRGGHFGDQEEAGAFAMRAFFAPTAFTRLVGFRCCLR